MGAKKEDENVLTFKREEGNGLTFKREGKKG
jgi:hypothetical protein